MTIKQIKERLENSKEFQYWSDEVGITFDDFRVIDAKSNKVLHNGSDRIGNYWILILDDEKLRVSYDLTVESMREKRLQKIQETKR
ncbi:hypothetical protein MNB_SM-7-1325 [hydrothermal vent metagenome]|uniref:Uncharacterized protein n=1 Tax=hydrothermal vent metagenome TaxID=652676 RepID=A0A1W1BXY2_9ZZZZ